MATRHEQASEWFVVALSREQIADGELDRIEREFEKILACGHGTADMALFARIAEGNGCEIYFSPPSVLYASLLIQHYGGRRCDKPPDDLTFLLGGLHGVERHVLPENPHRRAEPERVSACVIAAAGVLCLVAALLASLLIGLPGALIVNWTILFGFVVFAVWRLLRTR